MIRMIAGSLNETRELVKNYAEKRTESEILNEYLEIAKNKEKEENGKIGSSKFSENALAEVLSYSKGVVHKILKEGRAMEQEDKRKLEDYLSLPIGSLDPENDQINKGYINYMRKMNPDLEKNILDNFEHYEESIEYNEYDKNAKKQVCEIEEWFKDIGLEDCYRLTEYMDYYQEINDSCWEFLLYFVCLNGNARSYVRKRVEEITVPVSICLKTSEVLARFKFIANITDDLVIEKVKQDLNKAQEAGKASAYREQKVREQYFEKMKQKLDYSTLSYLSIENIYKRFWGYIGIKKEEWEAISEFMILGYVGEYCENGLTSYQDLIIKILKFMIGDPNSTVNEDIKNEDITLVMRKDGSLVPKKD